MLPIRNVSAITAELRHKGGGLSSYLLMRYNLALTCLSLYMLFTDFELLLVDVSIQIPEVQQWKLYLEKIVFKNEEF